jgi:hypothetical protein
MGVAAVSYATATGCGSGTETSGNLMPPADTGTQDWMTGNIMPPPDASDAADAPMDAPADAADARPDAKD